MTNQQIKSIRSAVYALRERGYLSSADAVVAMEVELNLAAKQLEVVKRLVKRLKIELDDARHWGEQFARYMTREQAIEFVRDMEVGMPDVPTDTTKFTFAVGQRATRTWDEEPAAGKIVAAFRTRAGKERYVLELDRPKGALFIVNANQLTPVDPEADAEKEGM